MASRSVALATRWAARAWSILSVINVLIAAAGGRFENQGAGPSGQEWLGLALFPIGVLIGLAVAWFWEGLGGVVALACLVGFYALNLIRSGSLPHSPFFLFIGAPSILFIAAKLQTRR